MECRTRWLIKTTPTTTFQHLQAQCHLKLLCRTSFNSSSSNSLPPPPRYSPSDALFECSRWPPRKRRRKTVRTNGRQTTNLRVLVLPLAPHVESPFLVPACLYIQLNAPHDAPSQAALCAQRCFTIPLDGCHQTQCAIN